MKFVETTGKTVDIAVENGLKEMGLSREQVEVEVLAQGGGLLKKARVRLTKKKTPGEKALVFIEGLMDTLEKTCAVEMDETEEDVRFNIIGTDTASIIGHRGEVLDAIQHIASVLANDGLPEGVYKRISVDTEDYRAKREKVLVELAHRLESKAEKTGRKVSLEPMNPAERRIIHAALGESATVTTASEGREPERFVVIIPKNMKQPEGGRRDERNSFGKHKKPFKGRHFDNNKKRTF